MLLFLDKLYSYYILFLPNSSLVSVYKMAERTGIKNHLSIVSSLPLENKLFHCARLIYCNWSTCNGYFNGFPLLWSHKHSYCPTHYPLTFCCSVLSVLIYLPCVNKVTTAPNVALHYSPKQQQQQQTCIVISKPTAASLLYIGTNFSKHVLLPAILSFQHWPVDGTYGNATNSQYAVHGYILC